MNWLAVTFYTEGTGYAQEVRKLINSANALGVPLEVYAYPNRGDWRKNLNYKSECILRAMDEHPGVDIVFIDADAVIRAWPTLFDELSEKRQYDIAAHYFQWRSTSPVELLSGTLWIANTDRARTIIREWDKVARLHPEIRHQRCLQNVADAHGREGLCRIATLPIEYACIFDSPARRGKVAVIEHFQASRRLRRRINALPARQRPVGILTSAGLRMER